MEQWDADSDFQIGEKVPPAQQMVGSKQGPFQAIVHTLLYYLCSSY